MKWDLQILEKMNRKDALQSSQREYLNTKSFFRKTYDLIWKGNSTDLERVERSSGITFKFLECGMWNVLSRNYVLKVA